MSRFKDLNTGMNEILTKITANQDICKLLYYNFEDALSRPDIEDTSILLAEESKLIYTDFYIPTTETIPKSYLITYLDNFRLDRSNIEFKEGILTFIVLTHMSLYQVDGGKRLYAIINEIDEIFNETRITGFGKLFIDSCRITRANENISGYTVGYSLYTKN